MGVADHRQTREAVLTPSRRDRAELRRDTRSSTDPDVPASSVADLQLFPPEPDTGAPQPRVRAPLRVRRSSHLERRERPGGPTRRPSSDAASPAIQPVRLRPARPSLRMVAGGLDLLLLAGLDAAVVWLTLRLAGLDLQSFDVLPLPPLAAFLCLLNAGYVVGLTAAGGQTIGKMAWGLRVTDAGGRPVSVPKAVVRTLWATVSLAAGIGVVWMFFEPEGRALHDVLAGTRVLAVPPAARRPPREGGMV